MKRIIKIEELSMFLLSIYLFSILDFSWWWYLVLFLFPDISMLAYLVSPKIGAIIYNIFHLKAIAILLFLIGVYVNSEMTQLIGVILFGHASFDRVFDYGLKYFDSFNHTHLGYIGKKNK